METGFRRNSAGVRYPRNIITKFVCTYNGEQIFGADLFPAIAANPFITFYTVATESGTIAFEWNGDNGFHETASAHDQRSNEHVMTHAVRIWSST